MKTLLFALSIFLFTSCEKTKTCSTECPTNTMCTMEFRSITIELKDNNGLPVALDKYRTIKLENNEEIDLQTGISLFEDTTRKNIGTYPILDDSHTEKTDRCGKQFRFQGYINNQVVVDSKYKISHDCCHIQLDSGNTKIKL
jgi:hypothetical protein